MIASILAKCETGRRLTPAEGLRLLESHDLAALGRRGRRVTPSPAPGAATAPTTSTGTSTTRTSAPAAAASAPSRASPAMPTAYVLGREELFRKIEETIALGRQSDSPPRRAAPGARPSSGTNDLLRDIKERFPRLNVHGFSPPEIDHSAEDVRSCPSAAVLRRLKDGRAWGRLPGGGAEILVDRVRREVSPGKASADRWLDVCRAWHALGRPRLGHDDVRPRRDAWPSGSNTWSDCANCRTRRTVSPPSSAGRFSRATPRLADLPKARRLRIPEDAGRQPPVSRQFRQPAGQLGHAGLADRPIGPAVRGQRFRQRDDRRERRGGGRDELSRQARPKSAAPSRRPAMPPAGGTCFTSCKTNFPRGVRQVDPRPPTQQELLRRSPCGGFEALRSLSFHARPGQIYGLLGPNGAGKTTALRILSTVLAAHRRQRPRSTASTCRLAPDQVRRQIGFLSANTAVYDRMTGWEMVEYFGRLHGIPEERAAASGWSASSTG